MSLPVLSITQLYPGARTGREGLFIHRRLKALPAPFAPRVWRVRPSFPLRGGPRPPAMETVDGIQVEDVPFFYLPLVLKSLDGSFLLRALRRRDPGDARLIDAHFAYPAGFAAVHLAQRARLPVVVTLRGTEAPYAREGGRRARIRECLRLADRIVCVSSSLADLARELGAPADRIRVIGNGVDLEALRAGDAGRARERWDLPAGRRILLTVGGLSERKGVRRVLEALPELLTAHPDLLYVVAGGGGRESSEELAIRRRLRELGLEAVVRLLGEVDAEDVPDLYAAADAFVLATRNEGWCNALTEAIAAGLPLVVTDVGGNREVCAGRASCRLVPFGDGEALLSALLETLATPTGTRFHEGPPRSWEDVGRDVAAVFRELL